MSTHNLNYKMLILFVEKSALPGDMGKYSALIHKGPVITAADDTLGFLKIVFQRK